MNYLTIREEKELRPLSSAVTGLSLVGLSIRSMKVRRFVISIGWISFAGNGWNRFSD